MASAAEWALSQRAQALSTRTIDARCLTVDRLERFTGHNPVDATSAEITAFLASLKVGRCAASTYHSHLRAWFKWLNMTEVRDDDPMRRVPRARAPKRHPRPVTDRELAAILAVTVRRRTRMMIYLAAYQGMRVSEIARIRGEDVNLRDGLLRVAGKGESDYELPLHRVVAEEALLYPRSGWWFPSYTRPGAHMRGQSVSQTVRDVFERAGVDGGAHRLRHWYGTRLLDGGANIRVVQELLRHAYVQTTQVYTQVSHAQQKCAIDTLAVTPSMAAG